MSDDETIYDDDPSQCPMDVSPSLVDTYLFRLPRAYTFADYIWPGLLMTPERLRELTSFDFRPSDILICSYPKSGTTWISEIISLLVHRGDVEQVKRRPLHERVPWLELDDRFAWVRFFVMWKMISNLLGVDGVRRSSGNSPAPGDDEGDELGDSAFHDAHFQPRVFFTHLPLELLPKSVLDGRCKIVYVARNPKDNAVSFYHFHQMARFLGLQKTSWSEFFPLYAVGKVYCGSWFEHVQSFWRFSKVNDKVLFVKYEDMKANLRSEVSRVAGFLEMREQLSPEVLDRVTRHCTFSTMKENRMANRAGVWLFDQSISKFMRKGMVGDWKNYFTVAQSDLFDSVYAARMRLTPDLVFAFDECSVQTSRTIQYDQAQQHAMPTNCDGNTVTPAGNKINNNNWIDSQTPVVPDQQALLTAGHRIF